MSCQVMVERLSLKCLGLSKFYERKLLKLIEFLEDSTGQTDDRLSVLFSTRKTATAVDQMAQGNNARNYFIALCAFVQCFNADGSQMKVLQFYREKRRALDHFREGTGCGSVQSLTNYLLSEDKAKEDAEKHMSSLEKKIHSSMTNTNLNTKKYMFDFVPLTQALSSLIAAKSSRGFARSITLEDVTQMKRKKGDYFVTIANGTCIQLSSSTALLLARYAALRMKSSFKESCLFVNLAGKPYDISPYVPGAPKPKKSLQLQCDRCEEVFNSESKRCFHQFNNHKRVISSCETCGKAFADSSNLKRHILVHSNNRPYSCHKCHKSFKDPSTLRQHIEIKTVQTSSISDFILKRTSLMTNHLLLC